MSLLNSLKLLALSFLSVVALIVVLLFLGKASAMLFGFSLEPFYEVVYSFQTLDGEPRWLALPAAIGVLGGIAGVLLGRAAGWGKWDMHKNDA